MVWTGSGGYSLAKSLVTLIQELEAAYPDREWQNSGGTGTIGDAAHRSQGSASDHNPWLHNTVRALDVAKTAHGPDCEALFVMVNKMYGAHDARVYPNGYAIFNGRITSWDNPGGYHAQSGDPHTQHVHISTSQNPNGYNSGSSWPLQGGTTDMPLTASEFDQIEARVAKQLARYFQGQDKHQYGLENLVQEAIKNSPEIAAIKKKVGA